MTEQVGKKFDGGKPRFDLIPLNGLKETSEVLGIGAAKYPAPWNWMHVDRAQERYYAALLRHLFAWKSGEKLDPETGKNHLAHVMCNAMFILERDMVGEEGWEDYRKFIMTSFESAK
jgi:hypothetical protein